MFYYISGTLVTTEPNTAVIDNNGIAYKMTISGSTLSKLSSKLNQKATLYTYLNIYQDGLDLFGFISQEELSTFRMLISVSGVGPKAAMSVLSQMSPEKFAIAVGSGDTKAISKAPGVGAKTAARIILELKDKIAKQLNVDTVSTGIGDDLLPNENVLSEAANALMVLGYTRAEASAVLGKADTTKPLEEIITAALKKLAK